MPRIEDYAFIGDTETAALVSREGSIDWLCLPRFDSGACFAALLGTAEHGRWCIQPAAASTKIDRHYRSGSLILDTEFTTADGRVRITDCMPPRDAHPNLVRLVEGLEGSVRMRMDLTLRFDYGSTVPWVRREDGMLRAITGPDGVAFRTPIETRGEGLTTVADFTVSSGQRTPFVLSWHPSNEPPPDPIDAAAEIDRAEAWWREWSARCTYRGEWEDAVRTSLVVLKGLTHGPTGGIVAAPTTSLPEYIGGQRNWDYRYCWLRDATFTLYAFLISGYQEEAAAWRDWLLRSAAGDPSKLQVMYGAGGERRLSEYTVDWLPGYEGSRPVRVGNAAVDQRQLDIYGEVMDAMYQARRAGLAQDDWSWQFQRQLLDFLESTWNAPDEGIWEVRGPRQQFTHSKVLAWVAFDRAVKSVERFSLDGPADRWRVIRDDIHREVCTRGFNADRGAFTQAFGSSALDANTLLIPLVGFLPADDPRVTGTVRAIEKELLHDGFVHRYRTEQVDDGLPPGEGVFLACTFWLADVYAMMGRTADARRVFERLLALRNDLGLLAEQYDPSGRRQLGNFPQAFSHVGLVNTALNLTPRVPTPVERRNER